MPFPDLTPEDKASLERLTAFLTENFNEQPMVAAQIMGACIAVLLCELSDNPEEALQMAEAFITDLRNAVRMDEKWDADQPGKRRN